MGCAGLRPSSGDAHVLELEQITVAIDFAPEQAEDARRDAGHGHGVGRRRDGQLEVAWRADLSARDSVDGLHKKVALVALDAAEPSHKRGVTVEGDGGVHVDFTGLSQALEPGELVALLNACQGEMTDLHLEEGGTVDKYIGDAIVAMFGAPLEQPDHAAAACRAAWRCQQMLAARRPEWEARGWPAVHVRIGLNSGPALVGNMGSDKRFDYTMLGDTVNLAARLEGTNAVYRTWIMVGEETAAQVVGDIVLRELDRVRVKGKLKPVRVFEVLAPSEHATSDQRALAARSGVALEAWRDQQWEEARTILTPLAEAGDGWAQVFLERVAAFEANPPPEDWDGVFVMTTK